LSKDYCFGTFFGHSNCMHLALLWRTFNIMLFALNVACKQVQVTFSFYFRLLQIRRTNSFIFVGLKYKQYLTNFILLYIFFWYKLYLIIILVFKITSFDTELNEKK
jgi:hypothetical protein